MRHVNEEKDICSFSRKFRKLLIHSSMEIPRNSKQEFLVGTEELRFETRKTLITNLLK